MSEPFISSCEYIEDLKDLIVFSCILYNENTLEGQLRFELFVQFMSNAEKLGIDVVVVDDGTSQNYLEQLKKFRNLTVVPKYENPDQDDLQNNKMSASRRFAARSAIKRFPDKKYFLYTVPEKVNLIERDKLSHIVTVMTTQNLIAAVIGRNSMDNLPEFQKYSERRGNYRLSQLLSGKITWSKYSPGFQDDIPVYDFFFGVGIFNREGLEDYYFRYRGNSWSEDAIPLLLAIKERVNKVVGISIDFTYPDTQMQFEREGDPQFYMKKRLIQFQRILTQARQQMQKQSI